jgi:hypothetical protein
MAMAESIGDSRMIYRDFSELFPLLSVYPSAAEGVEEIFRWF